MQLEKNPNIYPTAPRGVDPPACALWTGGMLGALLSHGLSVSVEMNRLYLSLSFTWPLNPAAAPTDAF